MSNSKKVFFASAGLGFGAMLSVAASALSVSFGSGPISSGPDGPAGVSAQAEFALANQPAGSDVGIDLSDIAGARIAGSPDLAGFGRGLPDGSGRAHDLAAGGGSTAEPAGITVPAYPAAAGAPSDIAFLDALGLGGGAPIGPVARQASTFGSLLGAGGQTRTSGAALGGAFGGSGGGGGIASAIRFDDGDGGAGSPAASDALSPVPVPAGLPLLAVGLGGLILLRRRRAD